MLQPVDTRRESGPVDGRGDCAVLFFWERGRLGRMSSGWVGSTVPSSVLSMVCIAPIHHLSLDATDPPAVPLKPVVCLKVTLS